MIDLQRFSPTGVRLLGCASMCGLCVGLLFFIVGIVALAAPNNRSAKVNAYNDAVDTWRSADRQRMRDTTGNVSWFGSAPQPLVQTTRGVEIRGNPDGATTTAESVLLTAGSVAPQSTGYSLSLRTGRTGSPVVFTAAGVRLNQTTHRMRCSGSPCSTSKASRDCDSLARSYRAPCTATYTAPSGSCTSFDCGTCTWATQESLICVPLEWQGGRWRNASGVRSCHYDSARREFANPIGCAVPPRFSSGNWTLKNVTVEARAITDPYVQLMNITRGSAHFGLTPEEQKKLGESMLSMALLAVGAVVLFWFLVHRRNRHVGGVGAAFTTMRTGQAAAYQNDPNQQQLLVPMAAQPAPMMQQPPPYAPQHGGPPYAPQQQPEYAPPPASYQPQPQPPPPPQNAPYGPPAATGYPTQECAVDPPPAPLGAYGGPATLGSAPAPPPPPGGPGANPLVQPAQPPPPVAQQQQPAEVSVRDTHSQFFTKGAPAPVEAPPRAPTPPQPAATLNKQPPAPTQAPPPPRAPSPPRTPTPPRAAPEPAVVVKPPPAAKPPSTPPQPTLDGPTAIAGAVAFTAPEQRGTERTRLFHVSGSIRETKTEEVPLTADSLNEGDVFILDTAHVVYVFQGQTCSPGERNAAAREANRRAEERTAARVQVVTSEDAGGEFWSALGGKKPIRES